MVAVAAADENQVLSAMMQRRTAGEQGEGEAELVLGGESAGGQQNRRGGQRDAELLHQNPGKEQQVAVGEQDVGGEFHG